jgi:hypothetical protein
MQDIYNYTPETNHVYRGYSVVLQFVLRVMLFRVLNMVCTFALVRTAVCVQCPTSLSFVVP